MWKLSSTIIVTGILASLMFSCSSDDGVSNDNIKPESPEEEIDYGEGLNVTGLDVYTKRIRNANTFTCATCHSIDSDDDTFRRVGHDLKDAAARTTFKNGRLTSLRDAVNNCIEHWMVGSPWSAEDERWLALSTWLKEMAPATTENLTFEIVAPPPADFLNEGGDAIQGMVTFNATCAACHGGDGVGTQLGPELAGLQSTKEEIAEKIRLSGPEDSTVYDGLKNGVMPFWSKDRLTDEEIRDISTFIEETVTIEPMDPSLNPDGEDISVADAQSNCGSTHPDIGKSAVLTDQSTHKVAGTVHLVDDCTIEIRGFDFDGGGIDVRIYGASNGNFDRPPEGTGFAISKDIEGTSYNDDKVTIRLPASVTLDQVKGISVWCVPIGIDFGSATW